MSLILPIAMSGAGAAVGLWQTRNGGMRNALARVLLSRRATLATIASISGITSSFLILGTTEVLERSFPAAFTTLEYVQFASFLGGCLSLGVLLAAGLDCRPLGLGDQLDVRDRVPLVLAAVGARETPRDEDPSIAMYVADASESG